MKNKFLKVISIILIIFGIMGLVNGVNSIMSFSESNKIMVENGMKALPSWYMVVALLDPIAELASGVIGLLYKSKSMVRNMGIIYLVVVLISMVLTAVVTSVGIAGLTGIVGIIFPIIYLVAAMKSKE